MKRLISLFYIALLSASIHAQEKRLALVIGNSAYKYGGVKVVILDACRNNPFERSWTRSASGKGLVFMNAPKGTLIAYATAPGSTASDGEGMNGLYTEALLKNIKKEDITVLQVF